MGIDRRNHLFAPRLSPGWRLLLLFRLLVCYSHHGDEWRREEVSPAHIEQLSIETLVIYKLRSRNFTTQNDLYW